MARYLIQSRETWCFLHSHPERGDVMWTPSLQTALRHGVVAELDDVAQLVQDHCDSPKDALVVDLDEEVSA